MSFFSSRQYDIWLWNPLKHQTTLLIKKYTLTPRRIISRTVQFLVILRTQTIYVYLFIYGRVEWQYSRDVFK